MHRGFMGCFKTVRERRRHKSIWEDTVTNLQEYHHAEDTGDKKSRTMVAIVIALVMAGFAVYVYESGMWNPQPNQPVQDSQLPAH
jgi:hypothetical protein